MSARVEAQTIDDIGLAFRRLLAAHPGPPGRDRVRLLLEQVLGDREFWARYLGDDQPERRVLYHDARLGFSILGHVFHEARRTHPHDHGATWAIYGQFEGTTLMDEWKVVEPPSADRPGTVTRVETVSLTPGRARTYNEGAVHSPWRDGPAKLVRIEGGPIDRESHRGYELV